MSELNISEDLTNLLGKREEEQPTAVVTPQLKYLLDEPIPDGGDGTADDSQFEAYTDESAFSKTMETLGFKQFFQGLGRGYMEHTVPAVYQMIANVPGLFLTSSAKQKARIGLDYQELDKADLGVERYNKLEEAQYNAYQSLLGFGEKSKEKAEKLFGKAEGVAEKFYTVVGATPGTVAQYLPAIKVTSSLPAGIALMDAFMASDKGAVEAGIAGVKGFTIGKYLDYAGVLAPFSRITSTSALGFALPANDMEERVANAMAFGTLSIFPGIYGERTKLDVLAESSAKIVKDTARRNKFIKVLEGKRDTGKEVLQKEINYYNELINRRDKDTPADSPIAQKLEQEINRQADVILHNSKVLAEIDNITIRTAQEVNDIRSGKEAKMDMVEFVPNENMIQPLFKDMPKSGLFQYAEKMGLPPSLALKRFPVIKFVTDLLNRHRIENENMVLKILDDPQYVSFKNQERYAKDGYVDFLGMTENKKLNNKFEKGTAMQLTKSQPGENGMFYFYNLLSGKEKDALRQVAFQVEKDAIIYRTTDRGTMEIVTEKGFENKRVVEVLETNTNPNVLKTAQEKAVFDPVTGEVYPAALKSQYKLTDNQVSAYLQMREGLESVRQYYNKVAELNGVETIPYIANYFPHMFIGNFRVYAEAKTGKNKLKKVIPARSKREAKKIADRIKAENPDLIVNFREIERGYSNQDLSFAHFAEAVSFMKNNNEYGKSLTELYNDMMAKTGQAGFGAVKLKRRQEFVEGFLGSKEGKAGRNDFEIGLRGYVEGAVKAANRIKLRKDLQEFFTEPLVNGPVYSKMTKNGIKPAGNITISKLYPNSSAFASKLVDAATGTTRSKITEAVSNVLSEVTKQNLTERQLANAFGGVNQMTLTFKLLAFNARFILSQGIQPYQMIIPKLASLRDLYGGGKYDPYLAVLDAQKEFINPSEFAQKAIAEAVKNTTINEKFINEFAGEFIYQQRARKGSILDIFRKEAKKGNYEGVAKKVFFGLTGREASGRVEQFSRLNATLMFAHLLKRAGVSEQAAIKNAWYMADNYMVRYDAFDRPVMYTEGGIGVVSRPAALFKTFQQNYYAQFVEHVRNASKYGDVSGLAHFVTSMVVVGGAMGIMGINVADGLVNLINKYAGTNFPTLSQAFLKAGLPDFLLFGVPSATVNLDLSATLAAPGIGPGSIFSVPGYQQATDVINATANVFTRYILSKGTIDGKPAVTPPTHEELRDAWKALTPNSLHGLIEGLFQKVSKGDGTYTNKGKARLDRELYDWVARYLSSYSIKEAKIIKLQYQLNLINKTREYSYRTLIDTAVSMVYHNPPEMGIPQWIIDGAIEMGYTEADVYASIRKRMKSMDRDILDNITRGDYNARKQIQYDFITNNLDERELKNEDKKIPTVITKELEELLF